MNLPNEELPKRGDTGSGASSVPKNLGDLQKTITMAGIAKAAGVSQGAISSLLNDRDYGIRVSEKTRQRVFKVCRDMGYIPNDLRAVVRMYPELGDFCLLISSRIAGGLSDPFVARIAVAAMAAIPDPSHPLSVGLYDESADYHSPGVPPPHAISAGVCSKFLVLGPPNQSLFELLTRRGLPVLSLGHDASFPGVISLSPDYRTASRLGIEHLTKLGHTHLAIVSGPFGSTDPRVLELNHGIRVACDSLGASVETQDIIHGDLTAAAGRIALKELLARETRPTAIFCLSDAAALGVIAEAQSRGIAMPKMLSVIGCGDDPCAQGASPRLTTIHIPAEEMAESGVRELDALVHDPATPTPRKTLVPVKLVERDSCAAMAGHS
jgi:DNA-binding LacI/PurR family transcriptional regulator